MWPLAFVQLLTWHNYSEFSISPSGRRREAQASLALDQFNNLPSSSDASPMRASLNSFAISPAFVVTTAPHASRAVPKVPLDSLDASSTVPVILGPPRSDGPQCEPGIEMVLIACDGVRTVRSIGGALSLTQPCRRFCARSLLTSGDGRYL